MKIKTSISIPIAQFLLLFTLHVVHRLIVFKIGNIFSRSSAPKI